MGWYDVFSRFYDASLEELYRSQRTAAAEALELRPGQTVLDVPCGTGQSFDDVVPAIEPDGLLIGVDASRGMLDRARRRAEAHEWASVRLVQADVHDVDAAMVESAADKPVTVDRLHVFLGLTAFPRWQDAFDRLWQVLRPGGRCVVVDVHAERLGFQGRMVNLVARADLRRRFWEPLEQRAADFRRLELESKREHGGTIYLCTGSKPDAEPT